MKTDFTELGLGEALVSSLIKKGYTQPTPIQEQAIPVVLEGVDLLATAQTGTGKTAGFALPILQMLSENDFGRRDIRALILTPTRELAEQIDRNIRHYARNLDLPSAVLVGGVSFHGQRRQLRREPAIVVATPGRLLDMLQQGALSIGKVETLVLDEGDRMLDMGFIHDVKKIIAQTPKERQTLLFSATISKEIIALSKDILINPKQIEIAPSATIAENLDQSVYFVEQEKKSELLADTLKGLSESRVLVFTRTKNRANRLVLQLSRSGIRADAIHSDKSQNVRRRTLAAFDRGKVKVLIATDVVARGIDVKEISHVINFELPDDPENYVHRIGRTARAEQSGCAYSFCGSGEVGALQSIERFTKQKLKVEEGQPFDSEAVRSRYSRAQSSRQAPRGRRNGGQGRGRGGRPSTAKKRSGSRNWRYGSGRSSGNGGSRSFDSRSPRRQSKRQARA